MSDIIRIDPEELTSLTRGLRRLSEDMETLEWRLQICQYRLSPEALRMIDVQMMQIRRRMDDIAQQMQDIARIVILLDNEFSACEQGIKRSFSKESFWKDGMVPEIPEYGREKHLNMPFTPKYAHFVGKAIPKRTVQI